jgi:hypothetical protein
MSRYIIKQRELVREEVPITVEYIDGRTAELSVERIAKTVFVVYDTKSRQRYPAHESLDDALRLAAKWECEDMEKENASRDAQNL